MQVIGCLITKFLRVGDKLKWLNLWYSLTISWIIIICLTLLKNSYGFSRCLFYSIQIEAVRCWERELEWRGVCCCLVESSFYNAEWMLWRLTCNADSKLGRFGDWMHQLRGSLLLTEFMLKLTLSKDQRLWDSED